MRRIQLHRLAPAIAAAAIIWSQLAMGANMQNLTDASTIEVTAQRWADAFNRGDVDAIVEMYTDDAQLLPEGSEAIVGRASIREFFQKMQGAEPARTIRFSNFEFFGNDPVVTEHSDIEIRDRSGKVAVRAKQILIRVKQHGQWKIHRDIWTTNGPSQAN